MIKLKLFTIALIGSILSWMFIKNFIVPMTLFQYFVIEFVVIISHMIYNYMRDMIKKTEE